MLRLEGTLTQHQHSYLILSTLFQTSVPLCLLQRTGKDVCGWFIGGLLCYMRQCVCACRGFGLFLTCSQHLLNPNRRERRGIPVHFRHGVWGYEKWYEYSGSVRGGIHFKFPTDISSLGWSLVGLETLPEKQKWEHAGNIKTEYWTKESQCEAQIRNNLAMNP